MVVVVKEGYVVSGGAAAAHLELRVSPPNDGNENNYVVVRAGISSTTLRDCGTREDVLQDLEQLAALLGAAHRFLSGREPLAPDAPATMQVGLLIEASGVDALELSVSSRGIVLMADDEDGLVLFATNPFHSPEADTFCVDALAMVTAAREHLGAGRSESAE